MAIVRQMNTWTYDELAFHLADSLSYRSFCRIAFVDGAPSRSAMAENMRLLRPETIEEINRLVVTGPAGRELDAGETVRIDSTVVKSPIHAPTDSWLLFDCVRVLARQLKGARRLTGFDCFHHHVRRAKRRFIAIQYAKPHDSSVRKRGYADLIMLAEATSGYAGSALEYMADYRETRRVAKLCAKIERVLELTARVIDQTRRRVMGGEKVSATDKVVSIFEPHTDVIVKDNRETYFGHKIFLSGGKSGLILDCTVEEGNPADSTRAIPMLERHVKQYGTAPIQASMDGAFGSQDNLAAAKSLGVSDICFSKRRGIPVLEMVRTTWIYKKLRAFRAGIESVISWLKRSFGLARCVWKGKTAFTTYVQIGVLSANLLLLARHRLE